jgi:hypothetical protein
MHIQLTPLYSRPSTTISSFTSASGILTSSATTHLVVLAVSDVKPNISGYVIIGIVLTILVLVLIGVFMVRRWGAHHLLAWVCKRTTAKPAGSSSETLHEPEKSTTLQMASRAGIVRLPPPTHPRTPAIAAQREFSAVPTGNSGAPSTAREHDYSYASVNLRNIFG